MFCKKGVLQKGLWHVTLLKKETPAQVCSCVFCKISENTFFHRTPPVAVSVF